MEPLLNRLLNYYGLNPEDYEKLIFPVDKTNFCVGHSFKGLEKAVSLVRETMKENGLIMIYGDYDADGVMGTSLLVKMFLYENYQVSYYLPNRYQDGYGLTLKKAQDAIDNHVSLLIAVDNGIVAFKPIELLKKAGVKVIVIDHHECAENLPKADFIIHPFLSGFGDVATSGAFTAFMFACAFLNRFDDYLALLAGISLVSDLMPLTDYNRNFLRLVIKNYRDGVYPAIDALKEGLPFNEKSIGLKIAPKINAAGRVIDGEEINDLVTYFTSDDPDCVLHYITWINEVNATRKQLTKDALNSLKEYCPDDKAIVFISEAKEGIIGLIANQLSQKYRVPVLVFTYDLTKTYLKGSGRAPEGFNLVLLFKRLKEYLIAFGGHALAGGCSLKAENFSVFRDKFIEYVKETEYENVQKEVLECGVSEMNEETYRLIQTFSPFGQNWPNPLICLRKIPTSRLFYSRDGKHILSFLSKTVRMVGFNFSRESMSRFPYIDVTGTLQTSVYKGHSNIEFLISFVSPSKNF